MNLPRSRMMGAAASLAVVATAAGVTLGVTTLLGVTFQGSGEAQVGAGPEPTPGAQTPVPPTAPSICVEAVEFDEAGNMERGSPAREEDGKAALEPALTEAATHEYWYPAGYPEREKWVVDIGCPSLPLPYVTRSTAKWKGGRPVEYTPPLTDVKPNFTYVASVFVMSLEDIDQLLGGTISRVVPQEMQCEGPTCSEVRSAVYVTPEEASDGAFMTRLLQVALGLESPFFVR
jgi:hypothetical protein